MLVMQILELVQYKILKIIQKPLKNYKCYVTIIDNKISMVKDETKP